MQTIKQERTKIINIIIKPDNSSIIYGLGDDNMVYMWDASNHNWILWG